MHGMIAYEELVRLQRANGERPKDECGCGCSGSHKNDEAFKGKTVADIAATPQPLRATCPHIKVVVPVTPAMVVHEPVKEITPKMGDANWRVVDFNKCDPRNQGLFAIPHDATVTHAITDVEAGKRTVDNMFDKPHEVTAITSNIKNIEAKQPEATGETGAQTGQPSTTEAKETGGKAKNEKPQGTQTQAATTEQH